MSRLRSFVIKSVSKVAKFWSFEKSFEKSFENFLNKTITKIFKGLFKGIYKGPKFCTVIGTLGQMWALLALGWVSQDF